MKATFIMKQTKAEREIKPTDDERRTNSLWIHNPLFSLSATSSSRKQTSHQLTDFLWSKPPTDPDPDPGSGSGSGSEPRWVSTEETRRRNNVLRFRVAQTKSGL